MTISNPRHDPRRGVFFSRNSPLPPTHRPQGPPDASARTGGTGACPSIGTGPPPRRELRRSGPTAPKRLAASAGERPGGSSLARGGGQCSTPAPRAAQRAPGATPPRAHEVSERLPQGVDSRCQKSYHRVSRRQGAAAQKAMARQGDKAPSDAGAPLSR